MDGVLRMVMPKFDSLGGQMVSNVFRLAARAAVYHSYEVIDQRALLCVKGLSIGIVETLAG